MEEYVYDETNRMVRGTNDKGEQSHYIYNGFGDLVANEWIIMKNSYGYHGIGEYVLPSPRVNGIIVSAGGQGGTQNGTQNPQRPVVDNKKFAVVHKDYVLDYTKALPGTIMEYESGDGGLTYRYTYGLRKVSTNVCGIPNGVGSVVQWTYPGSEEGRREITNRDPGNVQGVKHIVKLYHHQNRLGTTDYLTDNITGRITSFVSYDDFGNLTAKAVLIPMLLMPY
jgi:hypothetical protein